MFNLSIYKIIVKKVVELSLQLIKKESTILNIILKQIFLKKLNFEQYFEQLPLKHAFL